MAKSRWRFSSSVLIYCSHFLSRWGDRMWSFAAGLFLLNLENNASLRLPSIGGLTNAVTVFLFGGLVGDWIDRTHRLQAARTSLLLQNSFVCISAILFMVLFELHASMTIYFEIIKVLIIIFVALAKLSGVATKICVEKDWIATLCLHNSSKLAKMNAVIRRIDLTTNILAPIVTGLIMAFLSLTVSAGFIACWNIMSFFVEYFILHKVFHRYPRLAIKVLEKEMKEIKHSAHNDQVEALNPGQESQSDSQMKPDDQTNTTANNFHTKTTSRPSIDKDLFTSQDLTEEVSLSHTKATSKSRVKDCFLNLCQHFIILYKGWHIYWQQEVKFVGLALGMLYMTVLGFDYVTVAYLKTQHLSEGWVGVMLALGSVTGILGTFAFVPLRKRVGISKTGLVGLNTETFCLLFCVAACFFPDSPLMSSAHSVGSQVSNRLTTSDASSIITSSIPNVTLSVSNVTTLNWNSTDALSLNYTSTTPLPSQIAKRAPFLTGPHVVVFIIGLVLSRFGLWMYDLTSTQLILECVPEYRRGVVNGVQGSLNMLMDILKFILVILLPLPAQFCILVIISFCFVLGGNLLYTFGFAVHNDCKGLILQMQTEENHTEKVEDNNKS